MSHNFEAQRRETFATFKGAKGLPAQARVDFIFFVEELDAAAWQRVRQYVMELAKEVR